MHLLAVVLERTLDGGAALKVAVNVILSCIVSLFAAGLLKRKEMW